MVFVYLISDAKTPYGNFYNGEIRKVESDVAYYLQVNNWAELTDRQAIEGNGEIPEPVLLSVNNVRLGVQIEDF